MIILNYNGVEYIERCLRSVLETGYEKFEVILVDQASRDGSIELAEKTFGHDTRLKILRSERNLGFPAGNNYGVRHAKGEYLVFLNIDTVVEPDWLSGPVRTLASDKTIGIGQCRLLLMDNPQLLDNAGHFIDTFGLAYEIGYRKKADGTYDRFHQMFGVMGAAFIIRTNLFRRLGGFDPDYFPMWFEESDLCWRTWLAGYKVVYIHDGTVYHKSGFSFKGRRVTPYVFVRNRTVSMLKNYELKNVFKYVPANFTIMMGVAVMHVKHRDLKDAMAIIHAFIYVLINLKKILRKRAKVQKIRRIADDILIGPVIKRFNIRRFLAEISGLRSRSA